MDWKKIFSLRRTATQQVSYPKRSFFGGSVGLGVSEDSAMQVSSFYRGVTYISTQIAKLPWDVKDAKNNVLENDSVSNLLNLSPNGEMTSFNFRCWLVQTAIISGNAYCEIERDTIGRPIALWPLTGYVTPMRDQRNGRLIYKVKGRSENGDEYLEPKQIFHVKNFHTKDGIVGQGVVEYGRQTLGISLGGDRMASGLFANAGLPSGVLTTPETMSEEAYERLRESWKEQYSGVKAGRVAILEEGLKFEPLTMDPEVLQFLESRKFSVLEIARFLGVPPTKLFDMSGATYSNVENANLEVVTDTIHAWASNLEGEADVKLLTYQFAGKYTEHDLYQVLRGDMATRAEYYTKRMQTGSISPNEIRNLEGLPGYAGGNRFYIASNNFTPADRMDELLDSQITKNSKPAPTDTQKPEKANVGVGNSTGQEVEGELKKATIEFLKNRI